MTFFIIKRSDGLWRTEIVPMRAGDVDWYGGWDGGLARRSEVEPGKPHYDEISRLTVDDDTGEETALFQVTGVSADSYGCFRRRIREAPVEREGRRSGDRRRARLLRADGDSPLGR